MFPATAKSKEARGSVSGLGCTKGSRLGEFNLRSSAVHMELGQVQRTHCDGYRNEWKMKERQEVMERGQHNFLEYDPG